MARIRQRLRDVLGQEGSSNEHSHVSYQVFVEWIVENKANIQHLLSSEAPVVIDELNRTLRTHLIDMEPQ